MAITSKSDLLYGWTPDLGVWTGPGEPTFTRDGKRYHFHRDGLYRPVYDDVQRYVYPDVGDHRRRALDLALGDTPILSDSVRFDSGSGWTRINLGSEAEKSSIITSLPTNGEARELVGDGTGIGRIERRPGSSASGKECGVMVVEDNGDGGWVSIVAVDDTGVYVDVEYNFDTGEIVESNGSAVVTVLTENGENGGQMVEFVGIGTGNGTTGQEFQFQFDPRNNGKGAILHYAQAHELAFSPGIQPDVGSPSAIPGEQFHVSPGPYRDDVVQAWYIDFVAGTLIGTPGNYRVVAHGDDSPPRMFVRENPSSGQYDVFFEDASANRDTTSAVISSPELGQRIELAYVIDPADGTNRLLARADGGTVKGGAAATPASWSTPTGLGNDNGVTYNERGSRDGTDRGRTKPARHLCALGPSMDNDPLTGDATAVMDELAAVQPTTIKE